MGKVAKKQHLTLKSPSCKVAPYMKWVTLDGVNGYSMRVAICGAGCDCAIKKRGQIEVIKKKEPDSHKDI